MKIICVCIVLIFCCSCNIRSEDQEKNKGDMNQSGGILQTNKKTKVVQTPDGPMELTETTVDPVPQQIIELTSEEIISIKSDAKQAIEFISIHTRTELEGAWTLKQLDQAFEIWINADNPNRYSEKDVVKIVGSAFGEYCVENLNMRWVKVKDQYGTDYAVRRDIRNIMAFPYSSVMKSIKAKNHTFMIPVFYSLSQEIETDE